MQHIYIQVSNQTLHLVHVFKLRIIFLVNLSLQALQQIVGVSCILVELERKRIMQLSKAENSKMEYGTGNDCVKCRLTL